MAETTIKTVRARQLIDCKCRPLVEVDVMTEGGCLGRGSAPTGSSVGSLECKVLRDGNSSEYGGFGVRHAVRNVNEIIAPRLIGMDVRDQAGIDRTMKELDGTDDKHVLGGNAIYSTSIASFRAAAACEGVPLYRYIAGDSIRTIPIPSFNVINGGKNGNVVQGFNEFIVMPYRAENIEQAVEIGVLVFQRLGSVIERYTKAEPMVGRSYGWVAPSEDPEECLKLIGEAIDECGYTDRCAFALDCANSEMYDAATKTYYLNGRRRSGDEMIGYAKGLTEKYPFVFIEDMLDENDWEGFAKAKREIKRTLILADDFIVTNPARIRRAVSMNAIDGFILKPNQVGTITEALEAYSLARQHGLIATPSGRAGGVIGDVVMDLAVGLQVPFIKNGCPRSGERIDKLNFLMRAADLNPGSRLSNIDSLIRF
jgi:enolase